MTGRLADRRILITGGGAGIGLATAASALREGAAVALLDRRRAALAAAERALEGLGEVVSLEADVTDEVAVARAVEAAVAALGGLDGLVNCAAVDFIKPLATTTLLEWQQLMAVNLTGPMLICRAATTALEASGSAAIVNLASAAGLRPLPLRTAYCASKAGLIMFGKVLAKELAPHGVRVNTVCPGAVDTELFRSVLRGGAEAEAELDEITARYALGRLGTPEEIAAAVVFLLSAEAAFVTGATLAVDGGSSFH